MKRFAIGIVLVATVLVASPAVAQIEGEEIQIVELDNSGYPEIQVIVDVPQSFAGTTLSAAHFSLEEGDVSRSLQVEKLQETTAVVLAIDTSGSMSGEALAVAKQSALAFLDGLPEQNPVAVVGFGDQVSVASPLSTDRDTVRIAISNLVSGGETSLFDALVASVGLFDGSTDRVSIVLLSDGADTASAATPELAVSQLVSREVTLYSVGLETGESRLTELAAVTNDANGRYLPAEDLSQLEAVYGDLAARLANQYRLTFNATSTGPVEILVTVAGDDGALAVTTVVTELATGAGLPAGDDAGESGTSPAVQADSELGLVVTEPEVGRLQNRTSFLVGLAALFVTFSFVAYSILSVAKGTPVRRGLEPRQGSRDRKLSGFADWASSLVDRLLLDGNRRGAMNAALDRAGLDVRPGEFIVLTAGVAVASLALGWVINPILGLVLGAGVALSARSVVAYMGSRRRRRFSNQLDNTLLVLASSLRAGHGVQRGLSAVAEESESPTGEEFSRVVAETRIGRDLIEALQGVAERLGNDDFEWVVRAVAINRELGGNLAEVLDNVGTTIRERNQLRRQVQALSAEGRLSALILFVLPFGVGGIVSLTNPGYLSELTESTLGAMMLGFAAAAMLGGGIWIKKIVNVRF